MTKLVCLIFLSVFILPLKLAYAENHSSSSEWTVVKKGVPRPMAPPSKPMEVILCRIGIWSDGTKNCGYELHYPEDKLEDSIKAAIQQGKTYAGGLEYTAYSEEEITCYRAVYKDFDNFRRLREKCKDTPAPSTVGTTQFGPWNVTFKPAPNLPPTNFAPSPSSTQPSSASPVTTDCGETGLCRCDGICVVKSDHFTSSSFMTGLVSYGKSAAMDSLNKECSFGFGKRTYFVRNVTCNRKNIGDQ